MTTYFRKNLFNFFYSKPSGILLSPKYLSEVSTSEKFVEHCRSEFKLGSDYQINELPQEERKILKIGIIGTPNAGKSTLINEIVGRRIFPISKKVHTTRCKARAIHVIGNTQLVFLDTPGLVAHSELVKYNLGKNFMTDSEHAFMNADVIGVMHDVSNAYTRTKLDSKILRLLYLYPKKNTVLILNKVDCLRKKRTLLDLVDKLTCKKLSQTVYSTNSDKNEQITELEMEKIIKNESGWPGFQEIFMISALEGLGCVDIIEYLIRMARPGPWLFPEEVYTDQLPEQMIIDAVRSKLLDYVPQEMPYNLKIKMEYLDQDKEGAIVAFVVVTCPSGRVEKLIRGGKDGKLRILTKEATDDLRNTFQRDIDLRIVINSKTENKTL